MIKMDQISGQWLAEKLSSEDGVKEFFQFMDSLFERRFTLKHANIKKQELAYWKKEGLFEMSIVSEDREWTRFNFFDYVWLKLVSELRKLNMPAKEVAKVKQQFFTISDDDIITMLTRGVPEAPNHPKIISDDEIADVKHDGFKHMVLMFRKYFLPFNEFVLGLIFNRTRFNLLVNFNGEIGWFDTEVINKPDVCRDFLSFIDHTHVSIPIHRLLDEFYSSPDIKLKDIQQVFQLTKTEIKLFEIIRTEGITEVKIKLEPDKGGYILIETVHREDTEKTLLQLDRIVKKEGYKDITIKTEGTSIRLFEVRTKMKI
jgi:DNA-binding transcriptional MerR regulator